MAYRVLIVDDHVESAEGLAELLATWGYDPHVAGDGERALELVEAIAPQAVVTDIILPGIDGHELARRIRTMPRGRETLLVALTGAGDDRDFAASGFDHRLRKPVAVHELELLLDTGRRRSGTR
jgi:CheY-like chemotaxis protein